MASKKSNKKNKPEELRSENERIKEKLKQKKGAFFSESLEDNQLPSELENEFLKNIEAFENAYESAKRISVYNFIGKPKFKKSCEIPDSDIGAELENIINLLNEQGIDIDTICDVDDRVLYTFITEELFLHEIDDMRIEGMMTNFIYEEFHPNHEYDIKNHSTDFIRSFMDKNSDYYTSFLTKEAEKDKSFKNIRDAFDSFTLYQFEILSATHDKQKAKVSFKIDFTGVIENSDEVIRFSGEGNILLIYKYDFWCIRKVNLPSNQKT